MLVLICVSFYGTKVPASLEGLVYFEIMFPLALQVHLLTMKIDK